MHDAIARTLEKTADEDSGRTPLAGLVAQAREVMHGVTTDDLRKDERLREAVRKLQELIGALVIDQPGRKVRIRSTDEDAA